MSQWGAWKCTPKVKLRIHIDEPQNEPRAGNSIDFGALARDPVHAGSPDRQRALVSIFCHGDYKHAVTATRVPMIRRDCALLIRRDCALRRPARPASGTAQR